jgi:hypothetical protein
MKATTLAVLVAIGLPLCCTPTKAQTPSPKLTVSRSSVEFGDHDIGTVTPTRADNTLTILNGGDAAANFSLNLSGLNPKDFSKSSTCGDKVPAKGQCDITVLFRPRMTIVNGVVGPGPIARSATLEVKGDSNTVQVQLTGSAFQNLGASPAVVDLAIPRESSVAAPRLVSLTNYTDTQMESVEASVTGNFTEDHAGCVKVNPGDSCAVYVTYPPKQSADARGSLAFTAALAAPLPATNTPAAAPPFRRLTRELVLNGTIWFWPFAPSTWFLLGLAGIYFLSLVLVRWHMIAKPVRAEIVAEIRSISARVNAESASLPESREKQAHLREINRLLDVALYPFQHPHFFKLAASGTDDRPGWWARVFNALSRQPAAPESNEGDHRQSQEEIPPYPWRRTRVFNALFWTRGSELAGRRLVHEAERQFVELLPLQPVWARLEIAEQELRALNVPVALALADRVHESLASGQAEVLERERALLQQLQSHLKPLSVPEAARQAWLADLQLRAAKSFQELGEWISNNTNAAADVLEGTAKLEEFRKLVKGRQELADEVTTLEKLLDDPVPSKTLLQEVSGFFADLVAKAQTIEQETTSSTFDVNACTGLLASVNQLGTRAKEVCGKLKPPSPELAKAFLVLLDLCKARSTLVAAIRNATTLGVGVSLLQEILAAMQPEDQLIQNISQCKAASDVGSHLEGVKQLARSESLSAALVGRIASTLAERVPEPLGRWRALLAEALALIDNDSDDKFSGVTGWHNKLMWLVVCALVFLVGLGLAFKGAGVLLLVGAVGGLLSRLQRTIEKADAPNDYGTTWGALFLSPLTGALTAWGGTLLVILGVKLSILGQALKLDWDNPNEPTALAIALAFGFTERLFSGILDTVESKIAAPAGSSSPATPAPKITATDPKTATVDKENRLKVLGANFQPGATATVTDSASNPFSASRVDFQDATTIFVTFTPPGTKGYTTMLTVTNPDKQTTQYKLEVTET